ncbi:helix-turn-helix domain-containing protein [Elizabethkingia anophelis]|uniref:helix-turn-helix domain-containing protein n=2 Tax=Elizabethkingia anophelis TaxID=1117645 RepID=UPI001C88229D|nr:helix-turn-helix transcriptional regulator [Elizabethkingia anophelis]MCW2462608.1 transcriptional regulator with XRE-family HTH domain [Elizabethkingia anophelis]MCW2466293.1 transcriptional regulator with XRE-family HTH domain [Elizabethkingia anophelis]MCW2469977.1 transcriptional regulator with XRE-family HTH domain [Elizabethkingia anophelis]HBI9689825.1 helix-turn-helix transcriptional regulator [Elizabethkingia anophelis]HBI9693844.1 helix-turn-helix transcriptional regulator [Elizab
MMSSLGITLKSARKNVGLTLRQVEEMTDISNAYLSQLENDKIKNPSVNILSKLSSLYKVSLKTLLSNAKMIDKKEAQQEEINLSFAQNIAFRAEDLTEDERNDVLKYLEFIKSRKRGL